MSMRRIAQYLKVSGAVDALNDEQRWLSVPERNEAIRYQLWNSASDGRAFFEMRSRNRARNGWMSRFML